MMQGPVVTMNELTSGEKVAGACCHLLVNNALRTVFIGLDCRGGAIRGAVRLGDTLRNSAV
jgi:hypothetical protein